MDFRPDVNNLRAGRPLQESGRREVGLRKTNASVIASLVFLAGCATRPAPEGFLALALSGLASAGQDDIVQTSGRNVPVSGLATDISGRCDDHRVSVRIPVAADTLTVMLDGAEHVVPRARFDLTEGGRYPARLLPRCTFDGSGIEVVILFRDAMAASGWSRQAFEMDWSGRIGSESQSRPVAPGQVPSWFE